MEEMFLVVVRGMIQGATLALDRMLITIIARTLVMEVKMVQLWKAVVMLWQPWRLRP